MNPRGTRLLAGRSLLVLFMAATAVPFLSLFTTALAPQGSTPHGISWPSHPHWHNFVDAFKQARSDIATWEKQDELTPSEPQIDIGSGIAAQLAAWRNHVVPGPAVSFKPAVSDAARAPTTP